MISIIDYGMGNLGSVKRKLDRIRVASVITSDPDQIRQSDQLILPGVGHFSNAVHELKTRGLWDILDNEVLVNKKPILGICLGMQLMARHSEEGDADGFGWLDAEVVRFRITDTLTYKIPHSGWNQVIVKDPTSLFAEITPEQEFYFVHAYHLICRDFSAILGETSYEYPFVSAIQKENIFGVQFHPEKSHDAGELLLKSFVQT
jgi:glutamine amidotransferase